MVKRSAKINNVSRKSNQRKEVLHKKNISICMKKSSNLRVNPKVTAYNKTTQKTYYESPIKLIKESQKSRAQKAKKSHESNTCKVVPTSSLNDSVIILSDNEIEKTETGKYNAQNNVASGTVRSSLGEIFKSFQCLRKTKKNTTPNKIKRNIMECLSPEASHRVASNAKKFKSKTSHANSNESLNNVLNETIDDIVVVWSSINNSSTNIPISNDESIKECISDDEDHSRLFVLDYQGDINNFKYLNSVSNNENPKNNEETKENNSDLLFNKPGLKLPHCCKPNIPINVQPQKNIRRISARFYGQKSNTLQTQEKKLNSATQNIVGKLREIIIDGCNVAMAYTHNKTFSEVGLKLVIDYFQSRGHSVKAFVPQHKRSLSHPLLEQLYTQGIVVFTPSRCIGGKNITPYDDRYILEYATLCKGIVVSLDQYRDLYMEKPEWRDTIENRLLAPTFVGNYVMFPDDPLGRNGPTLEEFLRHDS